MQAWIPLLLAASPLAAQFDRVKPILVARCVKCHGGGSAFSGFDLTTREGLIKGGGHGNDVIPGNSAGSRLYQWVKAGRMPPDKNLAEAEIEAIRQWIDEGAEWSGAKSIGAWWSLETPRKVAPPGAGNPIDAFVLHKLKANGLDFAPPASSRALIRRLHFDLTGLPPKPEDYSEPYEHGVERLLGSHERAERWGRFWLDVVRFGETDGGEHNDERFNAWKYRDYVIDSFVRDKPYDQFIREQIAGDVLAPGDSKMVAATGFLLAGPWDSVTAKINKDKVMQMTNRLDELDDMVTTTFATFQAMTVNCARCHDHKFDPIPTRDYYRIAAAFNGAHFGERDVATTEQRAKRDEAAAPLRAELDRLRAAIGAIEDPVRASLLSMKYAAFDAARIKEPRRMAVNPVWNRNSFAAVTARHFRFVISGHGGKKPRMDFLELLPGGATVRDWAGTEQATPDKPAVISLDLPSPAEVSGIRWSCDRATASREGAVRVYRFEYSTEGAEWKSLASSLDHVDDSEVELPAVTPSEVADQLPLEARAESQKLIDARAAVQKRLASVPALEKVYAVVPQPVTAFFVFDRGSVLKPGAEAAPGALSAVKQLAPDLSAGSDEERRLALARWITDARNPLTARVIVNRVWQFHFGQGIVNTPSDFGFNGDRPSHPELLDWLATAFVDNGWSIRWLERVILTSRTYRQSSEFNEKAHGIDAGGRLLWRMPLKRMNAETLRDSILAVAGTLNPERGGPSFPLQKKGDRGSYIYDAVDQDGPALWRRSVYRFVVRGGDRIFMDSFDCPDPSVATPQRSVSNTALQALTLMNNQFVIRQSERLAQRLQREAAGQADRLVARAYALLYGREPHAAEASRAIQFLKQQPLSELCRALLNSNEFVYVP